MGASVRRVNARVFMNMIVVRMLVRMIVVMNVVRVTYQDRVPRT